jgi:phosphonate transport system ATP-binding protein
MLTLQNVSVNYGGTAALAGVDLTVAKGELVCLIGPSGAGKSTLLGLLNGRLLPDGGDVLFEGESLGARSGKRLRQVRQRVAWIPQNLGLVGSLRVNQNVACGRVAQKGAFGLMRSYLVMSKAESGEIHDLLARLGIAEKLYERVDHLSGGQQQRVAVARALFQKPDVILADEPVSAVDPERARDLIELLTRLAREENLALVASLHDVALARTYFDRIIGLRAGAIVFDGEANEAGVRELYRIER